MLGIIPARWQSTRFPGKPLAMVAGVPLVLRVLKNAQESKLLERIVVATDDNRIMEVVTKAGGEAVMTSQSHDSGTDRMVEVLEKVENPFCVNIQGDEPLLDSEVLDRTITAFRESGMPCGTLAVPLDSDSLENKNIVKVVFSPVGRALYFSRAPLAGAMRHVGLYLFRRETALSYSQLPQSYLEKKEKLEQLRLLENGFDMFVHQENISLHGVDRPEDIPIVEKLLNEI